MKKMKAEVLVLGVNGLSIRLKIFKINDNIVETPYTGTFKLKPEAVKAFQKKWAELDYLLRKRVEKLL